MFLLSIVLFLTTRAKDVGSAVFDKDDELAVEFVTAASNLRSYCYHIPPQSLFEAKVNHSLLQCHNPEDFVMMYRLCFALLLKLPHYLQNLPEAVHLCNLP